MRPRWLKKRDGRRAPFDHRKLQHSLEAAASAAGEVLMLEELVEVISLLLGKEFSEAVPNKCLGLAFEPKEFVVELKRRLLVPVYDKDQFCPCCDCVCDARGGHATLCARAGDRTTRRNQLVAAGRSFSNSWRCLSAGPVPEPSCGEQLTTRPTRHHHWRQPER